MLHRRGRSQLVAVKRRCSLGGIGGAGPASRTSWDSHVRSEPGPVRQLGRQRISTDTLFVFSREMSGPPMPVSIVRRRGKIYFTFQLDDSTSPMPSRKLSSAGPGGDCGPSVKVGQAMPPKRRPGGTSQPVHLDGWDHCRHRCEEQYARKPTTLSSLATQCSAAVDPYKEFLGRNCNGRRKKRRTRLLQSA